MIASTSLVPCALGTVNYAESNELKGKSTPGTIQARTPLEVETADASCGLEWRVCVNHPRVNLDYLGDAIEDSDLGLVSPDPQESVDQLNIPKGGGW